MSLAPRQPPRSELSEIDAYQAAITQIHSPEAPAPLLASIDDLAVMLSRSIPSLRRDDAAGRLPTALRIGGSKRWRVEEVNRWVLAGCPDRRTWNELNRK